MAYVCVHVYRYMAYVCVHVYSYMAYVCVHVYSYMAYVCVHVYRYMAYVCVHVYSFMAYVCVHVYSYMAYVCVHVYSYMAYVFVHVYSYMAYVCVHVYRYMAYVCVIIAAVNVFTPPGEVCSWETATSSCSQVGRGLEWSIDSMRVITLSDQSDASMILMVDGITFTVTLIFLNTSLIISNISFIATPAADGKVLGCAGSAASIATIRVVTDGKPLRYAITCLDKTSQKTPDHLIMIFPQDQSYIFTC